MNRTYVTCIAIVLVNLCGGLLAGAMNWSSISAAV